MSVTIPGFFNKILSLGDGILGVILPGPCLSFEVLGAALLSNPHPETLAHPPSPGGVPGGTCRAST